MTITDKIEIEVDANSVMNKVIEVMADAVSRRAIEMVNEAIDARFKAIFEDINLRFVRRDAFEHMLDKHGVMAHDFVTERDLSVALDEYPTLRDINDEVEDFMRTKFGGNGFDAAVLNVIRATLLPPAPVEPVTEEEIENEIVMEEAIAEF